jgi:predicted CoA-binding protein
MSAIFQLKRKIFYIREREIILIAFLLKTIIIILAKKIVYMTKGEIINDFISQRTLAIAGLSRNGKHFGNSVYKDLTAKGYKLYPVHPHVHTIDGVQCYPDLTSLPEEVGGVIAILPPVQTEILVKDAAKAGIKRVWMQQGAESKEAIRFCNENNINAVHGECIYMFAQPVVSIHKFHRFIWKLIGKIPK